MLLRADPDSLSADPHSHVSGRSLACLLHFVVLILEESLQVSLASSEVYH